MRQADEAQVNGIHAPTELAVAGACTDVQAGGVKAEKRTACLRGAHMPVLPHCPALPAPLTAARHFLARGSP